MGCPCGSYFAEINNELAMLEIVAKYTETLCLCAQASLVRVVIRYDELFDLLEWHGWTTYKIRKEKLIGNATYSALKKGTGGLDHRSIDKLCRALHCQPGDIMEYTDDEKEGDLS